MRPAVDRSTAPEESLGLHKSDGTKDAALFIIAAVSAVVFLRLAKDFLIPVALAVLISYAIDPVVKRLEYLRIPRALATALVLIGLVGTAGYGVYTLRHQAVATLDNLTDAVEKVRSKIREIRRPSDDPGLIGRIEETARGIEKAAAEAARPTRSTAPVESVRIAEPAFAANEFLWSGSKGLAGLATQASLVLFLVYFLVASGDLFRRKCVQLLGTSLSEKKLAVEALNESNSRIERFLLIQVATAVIVGICSAAALMAFGVGQPLVWGTVIGLLNTIPYFGPLVATASIALFTFLQFGSLGAVGRVSGVIFLITTLDGYLMTPSLMGKAARINGVAMFVGLLFWGWVWGVAGLIIGAPIMMVIKSVCDRIESLQPFGELLGE